jgi:hypothetical protein
MNLSIKPFCAAIRSSVRTMREAGTLAIVFKLTKSAEQKWRKLKGHARLAQVVRGVRFQDGLQEDETQRIAA